MKIIYRDQKKHEGHQLHVSTWHEPNWFEKWILLKSAGVVHYVGKGTKWYVMTLGEKIPLEYTPVTNKTILKFLKEIHP